MPYEATNQSIFQPYLKNMWHRGRVMDMAARASALFAIIPKRTDFFGEDQKVTVKYVNPMGRSANFQKAQSNAKSGRAVRFSVTRASNHASAFISNETIEASRNDMGALTSALDDQTEGAMNNLIQEMCFAMFRNGGGTRGQIVAIGASSITVSLQNVKNYEVGQVLKGGTTDGTTATTFRTTPATATITAVNRKTGVLSFATNTFAGTNWIVGDHLSVDGDIDETTLIGKYIKGFDAWMPENDPSGGESFFGVDRTIDLERLAGVRRDYSTKTIENALITLANDVADAGGAPDCAVVSNRTWSNLQISLGSRIQYDIVRGSGELAYVTFKGIVLPTDKGNIKVIADRFCQDAITWMLQLDTWCFHSLGEAPKMNLHNGDVRDVENADDVEFRAVYRANMWTKAPGHNGRAKLAS